MPLIGSRGTGRGYLGELGKRLQRVLGFEGEPNAQADSRAIPVMLVADATLPGYGDAQGRRFVVRDLTDAVNTSVWIRAEQDVILDWVFMARQPAGAGGGKRLFVGPPGIADPVALVRTKVLFLDRTVNAQDRPPVLSGLGAGVVGGIEIMNTAQLASSDSFLLPLQHCMGVGQLFGFDGGNTSILVYGRVL